MLDREGFNDAHKLKDFFRGKDWHGIFMSDMTRSEQTARIIADTRKDELGHPLINLRPWDVGYLTGKDKKKYGEQVTVFVENPDMVPRGGESRNDFFTRVNPLLIEAMEMGIHGKPPIIVGHSSIIHALAHLLWGEGHPPLAVKPGGVIEVYIDKKGKIDARAILKPGVDDSSFAQGKQPTS
jgi:broad specificity phosphatase PhoE